MESISSASEFSLPGLSPTISTPKKYQHKEDMSSSDHPDSKIRQDAWKSVLFGKNLLKKNESNAMSDDTNALLPESNMVLGVYFSALWCPPCEQFLRDLIVFYSHIAESSGSFEIVYISSDKDEEQFTQCAYTQIHAGVNFIILHASTSISLQIFQRCLG